jgi:hypothetical protein
MTVPLLGNKFQFVGCPAGCLVTILTELLLTTTVLLNRVCVADQNTGMLCVSVAGLGRSIELQGHVTVKVLEN